MGRSPWAARFFIGLGELSVLPGFFEGPSCGGASRGRLLGMRRFLAIVAAAVAAVLSGPVFAQPSSTGPLAPPANGPRHADSTFVAIVDCTVHPTPGTSDEHATVVFRDGRSVSVG